MNLNLCYSVYTSTGALWIISVLRRTGWTMGLVTTKKSVCFNYSPLCGMETWTRDESKLLLNYYNVFWKGFFFCPTKRNLLDVKVLKKTKYFWDLEA